MRVLEQDKYVMGVICLHCHEHYIVETLKKESDVCICPVCNGKSNVTRFKNGRISVKRIG